MLALIELVAPPLPDPDELPDAPTTWDDNVRVWDCSPAQTDSTLSTLALVTKNNPCAQRVAPVGQYRELILGFGGRG